MAEIFELQREIDRYTARITRPIRAARRRESVRREYAEYLEDAVQSRSAGGIGEEEAFRETLAALGDEDKITELLAAVHNKHRIPTVLCSLLLAAAAVLLGASYFLIDSRAYRAWFLLILQLVCLAGLCAAGYYLVRLAVCLHIRLQALRKIGKYAADHGMRFIKRRNSCRSLFTKTEDPEWILETDSKRYIFYLWGTVKKRKTLCLLANGLYTYSDNVGYAMLFTQPGWLFHSGWWGALPAGTQYLPFWKSELTQIPRGMRLMPEIRWSEAERPDRENVRVLLLNPVPFQVMAVEGGVRRKLGDDDTFCGMRIWSAAGFLSWIKGERLAERTE